MKKNIASQKVGAQLISAIDGSEFTGSVTVYVTGDAGTQVVGSVGSGACAHEGHGYHTYAPAQAETNYDLIAFTFIGTGAVPVTIQIYTRPTTGLLAPTVDGRTLDVSPGGEAGVDLANVGSPTTTLNLSGTTINLANTVTTLTNLPAITANWLTATGIAADAITAAKIANGAIDAATFAADVAALILSYLVNDATRIDATRLNAFMGETTSGLVAGVGTATFSGGHTMAIDSNGNRTAVG